MPPPSFFNEFFDENAIVSFFDVGFKDVMCFVDEDVVGSVDKLGEFVSDFDESLYFMLFSCGFDGGELLQLYPS